MSTDRELLELAAKAAGITLDYRRGSDAYYYDDPETGREEWCPLYNDGQALRLAVKLGLEIYIDDGTHTVVSQDIRHDWNCGCVEKHDTNMYAATRRAIVRAAAEIGRSVTTSADS